MQPKQPPSLCRGVLYKSGEHDLAATVAFVHEDGERVNLSVLKQDGRSFPMRGVPYDEQGATGTWRYPPPPKADPKPLPPLTEPQ